jgi:hypothetical protein
VRRIADGETNEAVGAQLFNFDLEETVGGTS